MPRRLGVRPAVMSACSRVYRSDCSFRLPRGQSGSFASGGGPQGYVFRHSRERPRHPWWWRPRSGDAVPIRAALAVEQQVRTAHLETGLLVQMAVQGVSPEFLLFDGASREGIPSPPLAADQEHPPLSNYESCCSIHTFAAIEFSVLSSLAFTGNRVAIIPACEMGPPALSLRPSKVAGSLSYIREGAWGTHFGTSVVRAPSGDSVPINSHSRAMSPPIARVKPTCL